MKILLIIVLALLVITEYAIFSAAHDADERAERMYREWKESKGADDEDSV